MQTYTLVQGDTAPQIAATITRADNGAVVDMSGGVVRLKFRKKGTTTLLFTMTAADAGTNFANGLAIFAFSTGDLATLSEDFYEGEIEIEYDTGKKETVYEVLDFYVREDF
jgi:Ethanolamine utilization protein EutJ (predicted chaperonin)